MQLFSPQNALIKHFARLKEERSYRQASGAFVVEGRKMVAEALQRMQVKTVLATEAALLPEGVQGHVITASLMKKVSSQTHPEGIVAEVLFSPSSLLKAERYLLVLDNLQDPGNLGTLIRTAVALNWEAIVLIGHCTDPFGPKALSSARGATFRIPIVTMSAAELTAYCRGKITLLGADSRGSAFTKQGPVALILGNEGQGLSQEIESLGVKKVAIPLQGDMESLNVAAAGAILLYGLKDSS